MSDGGGRTGEGAGVFALREQESRLLSCVHCGCCLPACPTYVRLGDEADSPRGRLYLMRAVAEEGRLAADSPAFLEHIDRCVGCRACEPPCPAGVEYGALLVRAREVASRYRPRPLLAELLLAAFQDRWSMTWVLLVMRLIRATRLAGLVARALPKRFAGLRLALAMLAASAGWPGPRRGVPATAPPDETRRGRSPGGSRASLRIPSRRFRAGFREGGGPARGPDPTGPREVPPRPRRGRSRAGGPWGQCITIPPEMFIASPVVRVAASEARNSTAGTMSSGRKSTFCGTRSTAA